MKHLALTLVVLFSFSGFAVGQADSYPNELEGFEFLSSGKLKGLELTISTRDDAKRLLGPDCEVSCELDKDWSVYLTYFSNISKSVTSDGVTTNLVPDPKYVNTLYSITITPRRTVNLKNFVFPDSFAKNTGSSVGHDFDLRARSSEWDTYSDKYGLSYTLFSKENYSTFKTKNKRKKGDLNGIEYSLPKETEDRFFVVKQ